MTKYEQIIEKMRTDNLSGAKAARALGYAPAVYYSGQHKRRAQSKQKNKKPRVITLREGIAGEITPISNNNERIQVTTAFIPKSEFMAWLRGE